MKNFELSDFTKFMNGIFELYEKSNKHLQIWFDDLKEFELSEIKFAFEIYRKKPKGEFFPRTAAPIISIIREVRELKNKKLESCRTRKCDRIGCGNEGFEPFGVVTEKGEQVLWLCRDHGDEFILEHFPDSTQAECIRGARKHIEYAKAAGMTNREWAEETGFVKKFEEWRQGMNRRSEGDVKHISEVF